MHPYVESHVASNSRKRSRSLVAVVAVAAMLDSAGAFTAVPTLSSSQTPTLYQYNHAATVSRPLAATAASASLLTVTEEKEAIAKDYYDYDLYYNEAYNDGDDEEDDTVVVEASVLKGFKELQRSTGSEILPQDLQAQIDQGAQSFLEQHVQDASFTEKVAMRSITEQLPQAAVQALRHENTAKKNKQRANNQKQNQLQFAQNQRVTPEQEIALARIIQEGAALHKLRQEHLDQTGKETLSRAECAQLAGLTPKELRRQVSMYRQAKHSLVTANMGLVHAVVQQLWDTKYAKTGMTREEMVQEGSLGLLRAAELFDPERGLRFSTYAVVWIKGTLSNTHVPELVRLPQREKTKWNKIMQAQRDILAVSSSSVNGVSSITGQSSNDVQVPLEELAAATGLSVADILSTQRRMQQTKSVFSLDYEFQGHSRSGDEANGSASTLESRLVGGDTDLAEKTQFQADLLGALAKNLDAREGRLMRLRYGLSDGRARTLHECAEAMGLSYTRVHQLAGKCLEKLRQAAEVESLEEYLLTIA